MRLSRLGRPLLGVVIGFILLAPAMTFQKPWQPEHIQCSGAVWESVRVSFPWIGVTVVANGLTFFSTLAVLTAIIGWCSQTVRTAVQALGKTTRRRLWLVSVVVAYCLPLFPTREGLPMILQLAFAGTGVLWLLWGLWPGVKGVVLRWTLISRIWSAITTWFLEMGSVQFLTLVFAATFGVASLVSWAVFEQMPHIQDNVDQLFHAKIFASGHLTAASHPLREFFAQQHMINNGRWYSQYPPGHTFMLMLGVFVRAPWIINPLLGAGTVVMFYLIGRKLFDEKVGRLAALLGMSSPFLIFLSSEFFSHATSLFFLSVFVLFFIETVKGLPDWRPPMFAGLALGMALITRPYTAFGFALPFAIFALWRLVWDPRSRWKSCLVVGGGAAIFVAVLLVFNWQTNGNPWLSGYEVLYGQKHNPGFGHSGWGPAHTPAKGLRQVWNDLNALQKYLFEWPLPSTLLVLFCFLRRPIGLWVKLLLAAALSLPFVHFFYWYQEWCFGPRLEYEMLLPLVLLSAKGLADAPEVLGVVIGMAEARRKIIFAGAACVLFAFVVNVPVLVRHYADSYWDVNNVIVRTVRKQGLSDTLVFVRSNFSAVFTANAPTLDGPVVYARDLGNKNKQLIAAYPGRHYYVTDGTFLAEIPADYYDDLEALVVPNGDFEQGTFDGWLLRGDAWGVAEYERPGREGHFHAESLNGGPGAIGELRTAEFMISGQRLRFLKNGWNLDPSKPNQYLLVDALTGQTLRTATPPNQEDFVPHVWDVADLPGRRVFLLVQDADDDSLRKDGCAWLGIDAVTMGDGGKH